MKCAICGGADDYAIRDGFGNLYQLACEQHRDEVLAAAQAELGGQSWFARDRRTWTTQWVAK